jgi:hypothetical protein
LIYAIVRFLTPIITSKWIAPLVGKYFLLPDDEKAQIEATLNNIGPVKVRKIHIRGTLICLPFWMAFMFVLCFPLMAQADFLFRHQWSGFVTSMPNWTFVLILLPAIMVSAISINIISVSITRFFHKILWPSQNNTYLHYVGEGSLYSEEDGFKVQGNYRMLAIQLLMFFSILYVLTFSVFYFTTDIITQTHYHKRVIVPFFNTKMPHTELQYDYDHKNGTLRIIKSQNQELYVSKYMLGDGEISAMKEIKKIKNIDNININVEQE